MTNLALVHDGAPTLSPKNLRQKEGEPRLRDLDIAEHLGFTQARDIRKIIERNRDELSSYGEVCATASQTSQAGGRPGREFWLNEGQALVICALSRTPQAAAVRRQIIEVFMAWRRGQLPPAPPARPEPAPIAADDLADYGEAPRIGANLLADRLGAGIDPRVLIDEHRAELLCLDMLDARGSGRRQYYLTERQALRLCMLVCTPEAGEAARQIERAFADWRRQQLQSELQQQQTVENLTREVLRLRGEVSLLTAEKPLADRVAEVEARVAELRYGPDDIKAVQRLLGLTDAQRHELAKWLAARGSNKPLTESQRRFRRRWHAQRGQGGRANG